MSHHTYAIGDIQGCFDELQDLLALIQFRPEQDHLWLTGDLVNRGPKSLEVLRFVKSLPHAHIVLGNHDLHLLVLANQTCAFRREDTLRSVIDAPDCDELLNWLRRQPLLHYDAALGYVMTHAGIYPAWDLDEAMECASELEVILQSDNYAEALAYLYGDMPNRWSPALTGWDRLRFIANAFMRMRFFDAQGNLEFTYHGAPKEAPAGYVPWFEKAGRKLQDISIVFGHWAALDGKTSVSRVQAVDTGCVWGRRLTAMRLEDAQRFSVRARETKVSA